MAYQQLGRVMEHLRRLAGLRVAADQTDGELLRRFAAGRDETAFAALLDRHGRLVLNVCRRLLGNEDDADDAFQATFLVLARKAGSIRQSASLPSWLYGVAYRVASKARSSAARRRAVERQACDMVNSAADGLGQWEELRPVLDEELSRLPEKYRLPIVLRYLQGKSNEEAAREVGCPAGTMSWRLSQALQLLRQRLARRGVTLSATLLGSLLAENGASAAVSSTLAGAALRSAALFAAASAGDAIAGPILTLAEGALQAMWIAKLKTMAVLAIAVTLIGTGLTTLLLTWGTQAAAVPVNADPKKPPAGGPVVNGLRLTLSADKTETVMNADGSDAEPVQLQLTFTNVTDQEINIRAINWSTWFEVTYPEGLAARNDIEVARAAKPVDGVIAAGQRWSWPETLRFPGRLRTSGSSAAAFIVGKPGQFRLKCVLECTRQRGDAWVGKLASNELVLTVKPAGAAGVLAVPIDRAEEERAVAQFLEEAVLQQQILARQFQDLKEQMLAFAQRLERSARAEDRQQSAQLRKVIETVGNKRVDVVFDKLIARLKDLSAPTPAAIQEALDLSEQLVGELKTVRELLGRVRPEPRAGAALDEQRVRKVLAAAEELIKEKAWADAVRALQSVLDAEPETWYRVRRKTTPAGKEEVFLVGGWGEAHRLIRALPPAGREFYELLYGARAQALLEEAQAKKDPWRLLDVRQRYLHTKAGEAADLALRENPLWSCLPGLVHIEEGQRRQSAGLQRARKLPLPVPKGPGG